MDIRISVTPVQKGAVRLNAFGISLSLSGFDTDKTLVISESDGEARISFDGVPDEAPQAPTLESPTEAEAGGPAIAPPDFEEAEPGPDSEQELFRKLTALRKKISSEAGVPPYVVFHDNTLREMARALPADLDALRSIQGVGKAKLDKYGGFFIAAIGEHTGATAGEGGPSLPECHKGGV